jgi:hypothetical protein
MEYIHKTKEGDVYITDEKQTNGDDFLNSAQVDDYISHLEVLIRRQKQSNNLLRESPGKLHHLVQKINGEFPNLLFEYDNQ